MKIFCSGLFLGGIINFFLFPPLNGVEIYLKEYQQNKSIETSSVLKTYSGDSKYYIKYHKVGQEIEFFSETGEKFWRMKSKEYPFLSYQGKLIFLLNGDQSRVRILNNQGQEIGVKKIWGRLNTVISFSDKSNFGALGFLDGSYYIVNEKGEISFKGRAPLGKIIKSISISSKGLWATVHFGDTKKDFLKIINLPQKEEHKVELSYCHPTQTGLYISDTGQTVILDKTKISFFNHQGKPLFVIKILKQKSGQAFISNYQNLYAVSYPQEDSKAKLIVFKNNGEIILSKEFTKEPFLKTRFEKNSILLKGINYTYNYSFHHLSSL